jgi:hypothetical protein
MSAVAFNRSVQQLSSFPMLKLIVVLVLASLVVAGCATRGSYVRIPSRFTALPAAPNSESYLIERIHASKAPTATRYDFTFEGGTVTAQVSTIAESGARSERRRPGETATRLLEIFRKFDWGAIEAPLPDDEGGAAPSDDTEVVIKARTQKSYREAHVRLAQCAALRKLLADLEVVK